MDSSVLKRRIAHGVVGLMALAACTGSMQATTLLSTSATVANSSAMPVTGVTCATQTGPPLVGQTITIHAYPAPTGTNTVTVGVVQTPGIKVTLPASVVLSANGTSSVAGSVANATGIVLTVNATAGCSNAFGITANTLVAGPNTIAVVLTASQNGGAANTDNGLTVTDTITTGVGTSALVAAAVTITCGYSSSGPVFVPGAPKIVSVTSAANLGTPFSVTTGSLPAWLVLSPVAPSGVAGTNAVNFTVQAAPGTSPATACGGATGGFNGVSTTYQLPLTSSPAPPVTVAITIVPTTITPLTVTPVPAATTISMTYILNSNVAQSTTVNVLSSISTSLAQTYYQVNNLPIWLTVNYPTGYIPVTVGKNLTFTTTTAANSLAPGNYTATVFLAVAQYADAPVVINLLVTNAAPKLSVTSANPQPVTYTLGGSTPITAITVASSDSPIPYTMSFAGPLAPMLTAGEQLTGIAYSFGTTINVTYNPLLFQTSAPGTVLSGTVTFTWGTAKSVIVVTINLTVASPGATLTSISPASLPTAAPGSVFYVTLTGNGFVGGTDPSLATKVGIVIGSNPGTVSPDTNFAVTYVNSSNLSLKITVPALGSGGVNGDANLPFLVGGNGGPVYLGVVNGSATAPTGNATLTIGGAPIIYGVTSSSSFTEVSGGALPSFAPYDMISIFGANFCSSADTFPAVGNVAAYSNGGCGTNTILPGSPDPILQRFPFSLTPDQYIVPTPPVSSLWRLLTVNFYMNGSATAIPAPLLFATNGQINTIVPGALVATDQYNIVVSFGCATCTPSTVASSAPFLVNIVATDPGIFTVGSDGQGPAAALAATTYALIGATNPAGMRYAVGDSDIIQVYMTGLGLPAAGTAIYTSANNSCISALNQTQAGYLTALNDSVTPNLSLTNIDGAVLQDSLFAGDYPPCLTAEPTVTIGGISTPVVTYTAFTGDTVAGLYQMNVQMPSTQNTFKPNYPSATGSFTNLTGPTQLPIFVTLGGLTSQAGVMLSVAPKLKMTVTGIDGVAPSVISAATAASPTVLTTGTAPATGTMIYVSGFTGNWASANGFQVATNMTGTTFSIPVDSSAFGAMAGTPVFELPDAVTGVTDTLSIGHPMITTAIVGNNNFVHTGVKYAVTSGVLPQGLTLATVSGVATITGTPAEDTAGTYPVTITATDTSAVPITGTTSFTFNVPGGLFVTVGSITSSTFGTANTSIATVTAVGGTPPYSLFAVTTPSAAIPGLTFTTGGVLQTDGTTPSGTYTITATATDAAGVTGTVTFTFVVKLLVTFSPVSPQTASIMTVTDGGLLNTLTVSGGVGPYTYAVDASSTAAAAAAGALNFVGNLLNLGTDVTTSTQTVVIDVVDTGTPASTAAVDTATSTAGSEFILTLILGS